MRFSEVTQTGSFYTFKTNNKFVKNKQEKQGWVWGSKLVRK